MGKETEGDDGPTWRKDDETVVETFLLQMSPEARLDVTHTTDYGEGVVSSRSLTQVVSSLNIVEVNFCLDPIGPVVFWDTVFYFLDRTSDTSHLRII